MKDVQEKFFAMNGGEIFLKMPGKWYIVELIRQVNSPYKVERKRINKDAVGDALDWVTIITFDYPCLPREQITVHISLKQNGIERAVSTLKNQ